MSIRLNPAPDNVFSILPDTGNVFDSKQLTWHPICMVIFKPALNCFELKRCRFRKSVKDGLPAFGFPEVV